MITIFIHGTLPPKSILKIPFIHDFFYSAPGLNQILSLDKKYHYVQIGHCLATIDPSNFDINNFYLFGWSGALNFDKRKEAARDLYHQINKIKDKYFKKNGYIPEIRLITHSHGGNVALYLKEISDEYLDVNFAISELILLACPVQTKTSAFITDKIFKNIFSLHSHKDVLQVIDPQGIYKLIEMIKQNGLNLSVKQLSPLGPIFSTRHFKSAKNLKQAWIKINDQNLLHIEFLLIKFIEKLPKILKILSSYNHSMQSKKEKKQSDILINLVN